MPSSFIVINAPKTTVVTSAGLLTAIQSAQPGEVLTVETAGAPLTLNLAAITKGGYGVCVSLPLDQQIRVDCSAATSNIHFFGGQFSADKVSGERTSSNYGLNVAAGCSKIGVFGALLDENANAVVCSEASDVLIDLCRFVTSRADHAQTPTTIRMQMSRNAFDSGAKGEKICYFSDGSLPQHNISSGACATAGGIWEDTAHNDIWQFRTGCADIIGIDNIANAFGAAGFVTFGTAGPEPLQRCLMANNEINDAAAHAITVTGNDVEIRDNTVSFSADAEVQPRISLTRSPEPGGRVRGGRNTAPIISDPPGVDLDGESITGDVVNAPEAPRINLPAWAPAFSLPPSIALAAPVRITGANGIRPTTAPSLGDWLTVNRGQWIGAQGISWEYRWTRNGTPISGATSQIYQVVLDDIGQDVGVEVRGTNAAGVGLWYAYTPRVPV